MCDLVSIAWTESSTAQGSLPRGARTGAGTKSCFPFAKYQSGRATTSPEPRLQDGEQLPLSSPLVATKLDSKSWLVCYHRERESESDRPRVSVVKRRDQAVRPAHNSLAPSLLEERERDWERDRPDTAETQFD